MGLLCEWVPFFLLVSVAAGHAWDEPDSAREFINVGQEALEKNQLHTAAEAFQKAVDINPSSAKAHEGLGIALAREIIAGNTRPSEDSDFTDRAESHLEQAAQLEPSSARSLIQLAELETTLAEQANDRNERLNRYSKA